MRFYNRLRGIDPATATHHLGVVSAVIVLIDGLLGYWLYRSESAVERSVAGVCLLLSVAMILGAVWLLRKEDREAQMPTLSGTVQGATAEEIKAHSQEQIGGRDGSYVINKPPEPWTVDELTYVDYVHDLARFSFGGESEVAKTFIGMMSKQFPSEGPVLRFNARNEIVCWAIPGKTTVDGRSMPVVGSAPFVTQLTVVPLLRYAPPLFTERSFYTNAIQALHSGYLTSNITSLALRTLVGTDRPALTATIDTLIEHVEIVGRPGSKIEQKLTFVAIAGDVMDHALVTRDYSIVDAPDPKSDQYRRDLHALIESFRPLRTAQEIKNRTDKRKEADEEFSRAMKRGKEQIFIYNLDSTATLLRSLDIRQDAHRHIALRQFRSLVQLADNLEIRNDLVARAREAVLHADEGKWDRLQTMPVHLNRFVQGRKSPRPRRPPEPAESSATGKAVEAPSE